MHNSKIKVPYNALTTRVYMRSFYYYCVNKSRQIEFNRTTGELSEYTNMSFYNVVTRYAEYIVNIPKPLITLMKLKGYI